MRIYIDKFNKVIIFFVLRYGVVIGKRKHFLETLLL